MKGEAKFDVTKRDGKPALYEVGDAKRIHSSESEGRCMKSGRKTGFLKIRGGKQGRSV